MKTSVLRSIRSSLRDRRSGHPDGRFSQTWARAELQVGCQGNPILFQCLCKVLFSEAGHVDSHFCNLLEVKLFRNERIFVLNPVELSTDVKFSFRSVFGEFQVGEAWTCREGGLKAAHMGARDHFLAPPRVSWVLHFLSG